MKAITRLQSPQCVKDVQRLTGRLAALNRFISRSFDKCKPFFDILKKNKNFKWGEEHERAFQEIKSYLSNPQILTKPREDAALPLYLAVSDCGLSAVLVWEEGDK